MFPAWPAGPSVAAITVTAAIGSALSPSFWVLIGFRLLLGFSAGGDYLVSAVLMSEYANRKDRGKLVGMVFGTQAPGLIVGPLAALALLGARARNDVTGHADARRGARRRGDLPTPQDARIAAVPRPGPRAGRAGGQAAYLVHRRAGQRPGSRRPGGRDGAAGVPDQPPLADLAGRDGQHLVPARLRLLRQHHLHPADPRPDLPARLVRGQGRPPACHLRGSGRALVRAGDRPGWTGSGTGGSSWPASR